MAGCQSQGLTSPCAEVELADACACLQTLSDALPLAAARLVPY